MAECKTEIPHAQEPDAAMRWPLPPGDWAAQLNTKPGLSGKSGLGLVPESNVIHVWTASLDSRPEALPAFESSLAPEEQARAARFHFPIHRERFIAGRGLLRSLLASYLGMKPGALKFAYGPNGKPALTGSAVQQSLHFNLAHSEDLFLVAVTRSGMVGVDVERVRMIPDLEELVARFFSPNEHAKFRNLTAGQKPAAFFNLWTRKEAWLKATGDGITHLLSQVEVSFLPTEQARLVRLPATYTKSSFWSLQELAPRPGFTAALAAATDAPVIHCWRYERS
jgi:4'-phosphopantetheinyl transferase